MKFRSYLLKAFVSLSLLFVLIANSNLAFGQKDIDMEALKEKAYALMDKGNYLKALPHLEKLRIAYSDDPKVHFYMGFALLAKVPFVEDTAQKISLRKRARSEFELAKKLGSEESVIDALIDSIPIDGSIPIAAKPTDAIKAMKAAESAFATGKNDDALKYYQKAHRLDPNLYEAALYSGDVYVRKKDFAKAEIWYQKAIAINPYRDCISILGDTVDEDG